MHNHAVGCGGHAHAGFVAKAAVAIQTLPAGAVEGLRGVTEVGCGVHPGARFSVRHGHGHGGAVTAHLHAITSGQFGGVDRLGRVTGGVLTDGEGRVDAALAVGAAVGSGSVALTQATSQQAQGVLTGGVLCGVFVILEGCVIAGGQVNPGVDVAVFVGGDDSPDGAVVVDRGGVVTGYLAVVNLQTDNGCLLVFGVTPAVTGQVQLATLNRLGVLDGQARGEGVIGGCAGFRVFAGRGGRLCGRCRSGFCGRCGGGFCSCARVSGSRGVRGRLGSHRRLCGRCRARSRVAQRNILRHRCTTVVGVAVRIRTTQGTGKHLNTVTGTLHGPALVLQLLSGQTGVFGGRQGHLNLKSAVLIGSCHEVRGRVAALLGERVNRLVSLIRQGVEELHGEHCAATGCGAGKAGAAQHELTFAPLLGGDGHGSLSFLLGGGGSIRECESGAGQRCTGGDERAGESHDGTIAGCGAHGSSFGHGGP